MAWNLNISNNTWFAKAPPDEKPLIVMWSRSIDDSLGKESQLPLPRKIKRHSKILTESICFCLSYQHGVNQNW